MSSLWTHALNSFTELEAEVTNFLPAKISPKSVVYRRTRRTPPPRKGQQNSQVKGWEGHLLLGEARQPECHDPWGLGKSVWLKETLYTGVGGRKGVYSKCEGGKKMAGQCPLWRQDRQNGSADWGA